MPRRVSPEGSLGALMPQVAATWHAERNTDTGLDPMTVPPSSPTEVWWRCPRGHEWVDRISTRTSLPKWKNGDAAACRECTGYRVRHTFPECGHTVMITAESAAKNRPTCADCYSTWWRENADRLKADLGAAARGFADKAQEMIAAVEVESAAPAPLVAEWRWWAAKHLQGALAAEQVMGQAGRVEQVLATITERARHLVPTRAEAGRAAAADGVLTLLERGHWAQGWLHHLTRRRPRPLPAAEVAQVGEAFHRWLNEWVRAVAAEHDPAHQGHSTARLTTALTRQITAFTDAYFPAETGRARAWRELGLPVLPPGAQRYGRLDVVLWHPVFAAVVIEIDSAPNRSSAAKLVFARDAGALALWVRFGKGSVHAPEGVPVVDLRQGLAPLHKAR